MRNIPDDDQLEAQFIAEFAALAARVDTIRLSLTPLEAWALVCQLQLACRHPENTGPTRQMVEQIARRLQFIVAPSGALAVVAERGWNPQYDVPRERNGRGP
jgi:hypothetical protein